ncbi:sigma-70 family RNA polymerase sigma factor [Alitabrizicola rongguiensis]|uniref:sigma-70 family RNA polymerase sigma factor n=1 Tax=Alitabrizicola rongguiensis TaxID=2909234 RepID=UPI0029E7DD4E|nr:sigma-70 family RNA polymerase sigma factor [Tabrizicola rongguiensis]
MAGGGGGADDGFAADRNPLVWCDPLRKIARRMTNDDPLAPLLSRVADGDRAAFRALYAAASAKLFGVALRILGTRSEAEDALQEVFTRVWLNARRFDPAKGRGMTWLIAIARNHAIDRLRARPTTPVSQDDSVLELVADDRPGAEDRIVALGESRRIADCMGELEPDRAAAITGAYLNGQSYQELAERFGVPLNTMRTWLRRSLQRLKECMER